MTSHPGTNATPLSSFPVGTEAVGYTTDDTTLSNTGSGTSRFSGPKWAGLATSNTEVATSTSQGSETTCQVYQVTQSTTTPAGSYVGSLVYTAVPYF